MLMSSPFLQELTLDFRSDAKCVEQRLRDYVEQAPMEVLLHHQPWSSPRKFCLLDWSDIALQDVRTFIARHPSTLEHVELVKSFSSSLDATEQEGWSTTFDVLHQCEKLGYARIEASGGTETYLWDTAQTTKQGLTNLKKDGIPKRQPFFSSTLR